ncbi:shikimate dehydrogenase substrate-binding domain protein [Bacteriovorax sp. Seq25_V]|uniref:shikimate dehydrogenase substrate-binding domain protein n=1 Tax=Bacteriovorax sp. Seq25_V TaxID=1201288 RepID=UPI00038A0A01|nr:shikimate dehydrogenase substrate-binding domain protein [Bacteriovorax sp. Seq25_V]EQC43507.1 shikimate dehydrogenase substrate-binding domain protein [Bacteriovorax sp. Seq25_V]
MKKLALIGRNISHSKSQLMYEKIFKEKIDYALLDYKSSKDIPSIKELLDKFMGVSITAPYKDHFLSQVEVENDISSLGAINCIAYRDGRYLGTNTDYLAVLEILQDDQLRGRNIIVLGDGAMSRVTKLVLDKLNLKAIFLNRKKDGDLNLIDYNSIFCKNLLVINSCARQFSFTADLPPDSIFWDYNYSHIENNSFLKDKCNYVDGIDLLFLQAKYATQFWKLDNK